MKRGGGAGRAAARKVVGNSSSKFGSNEKFKQPDTKSKCNLTFPEFENKERMKAGQRKEEKKMF